MTKQARKERPVLALISQTLRRDLEEPLRHFKAFSIVHFYTDASYGDMKPNDFASEPIRYQTTQELVRHLERIKPTIIQAQEPYASRLAFKNCWAIAGYVRRTKTPFVFPVFENRPVLEKFGPILGLVVQRFVRWFGNQAAGIIVLNDGAKRNLLAAGIPPSKLTRLNWGTWGIDCDEFVAKPRNRSRRPIVFFVGRVAAAKGVPELLEAWPEILKAVPAARLVIGGPCTDPMLNEQIRHSPATDFVGPIKNADLPGYFQKAWVTVTPSVTTKIWEEQVGMINLQSLACGTPVVSTRSGAIPEYVSERHGATLVPEHDAAAIAAAVTHLLADRPGIDRLGVLGRRFVAKHYEVRANILQDERYLQSLLRQRIRS